MKDLTKYVALLCCLSVIVAQNSKDQNPVPKPLFDDLCDVVVNDGKAYVFYFTHPGRNKVNPAVKGSFEDKCSVIQLEELKYVNGEIACDRDAPVKIRLK